MRYLASKITDLIDKLFVVTDITSQGGTLGEKGTGLGLILCADFIERHKGRIWVESKEKEGSTFYFSIPTVQS
jgi:signal transduction histidine kinase